jgi:hypothetical protein
VNWQNEFQREITLGHQCPCCTFPYSVTAIDGMAFTWRCNSPRKHTSWHYIKLLKKRAERVRAPSSVAALETIYKDVYKDIYAQAPWAGWGWGKEEEKKEKVGDTNEFGEICP